MSWRQYCVIELSLQVTLEIDQAHQSSVEVLMVFWRQYCSTEPFLLITLVMNQSQQSSVEIFRVFCRQYFIIEHCLQITLEINQTHQRSVEVLSWVEDNIPSPNMPYKSHRRSIGLNIALLKY